MAQPIVLDNTILNNLARVGGTDLIVRLWGEEACTTVAVMKEYVAGVDRGLLPRGAWSELSVIELTDEEEAICQALPPKLGEGETSCIAVAQQRDGVLVTDDLDARKTAASMDLPTTGTIGALVLSVKQGLISLDEGNRLLKLMIERDYRAPVDKLDALVQL